MIITLTPNPSLDRTLEVGRFARGGVLRARARRVEPGGKGINVARALHAHGHEVLAVLPCGGGEGEQLVRLLTAEGLTPVIVPIADHVRANVAIVEPDGTVTKVNEPGPTLDADEIERLLATVAEGHGATWVVGSGSLPPGCSDGLFAALTERAHGGGSRVVIDSSGTPLSEALAARPDLVKPNLEELTEVTGLPVRTLGEAVAAARLLRQRGVATVLASLGEDGALLVDEVGALHAHVAVAAPRSSVGAGDATLAGYLTAAELGRRDALRMAVAFGAAAVALPGSQMPGPSDVRPGLVEVTDLDELDPDRVLCSAPSTDARAAVIAAATATSSTRR
jgi:1-phosphofructokinase